MRNIGLAVTITMIGLGGVVLGVSSLRGGESFDTRDKAQENTVNGMGTTLSNGIQDDCETRAVWINAYSIDTLQERTDQLQKIVDANMNTVFVLAPPVGAFRGWSTPADFSAFLTAAEAQGIVVHGWIANACRIDGTCAVDYRNAGEKELQRDWALALLAEYPDLDGIQLDYIRYYTHPDDPIQDIDESKMLAVNDTVQMIYNAVKAQYPNKLVSAATLALSGDVVDFDTEYVPAWYETWFNDPANDPVNRWDGASYNYSGAPTGFKFQQDPVTWMNGGYIDGIFSMEYYPDHAWWAGEVDIWNSFPVPDMSYVNMGTGWYSKLWDGERTPEEVAEVVVDNINYGRVNNISGFATFEFGEDGVDDSILIDALTVGIDAPYVTTATTCHSQTAACTEDDWEVVVTDCQLDNTYTRTWTKTGTCEGGVTHPATETLACTYMPPRELFDQCTLASWTYVDGECQSDGTFLRTWTKVGECEGGVMHPATESLTCGSTIDPVENGEEGAAESSEEVDTDSDDVDSGMSDSAEGDDVDSVRITGDDDTEIPYADYALAGVIALLLGVFLFLIVILFKNRKSLVQGG